MSATARPASRGRAPDVPSWGSWLGERMQQVGLRANSDLARAAGIPDSAVSRWRTAGTLPTIVQLRRLSEPLQATILELLVAAGHLSSDEAALREVAPPVPAPQTPRQVIAGDPDLPDDLRHLLVLQYDAMLAVARARGDAIPS